MAEEKKKENDEDFYPILTDEDKAKIQKKFDLIALRIPCKNISKLGNALREYSFDRKGIKRFQADPQNETDSITQKPLFKCLLLCKSIKTTKMELIPQHTRERIVNELNAKPIEYALTLSYAQLSPLEILRHIIDDDEIELPTHYEAVGHIVHFNLRQQLQFYKYLIGQIYLDKLPNSVRTIVNKTGCISNQFRVFPMERIAGIDQMECSVKENGCTFLLNFASVYWNSRLGSEHRRICDLVNEGEIVCDMMAGIGPFAVPSAKHKKCTVFANDLNPESFRYLQRNAKQNKVEEHVHCYNLDARAFWKELCRKKEQIIAEKTKKKGHFIQHVIMNLPAIALQFLDVFKDCFSQKESKEFGLPQIYCYCFAKNENFEESITERVEKHLGAIPNDLKIRLVRNVAPYKNMYCVTFKLPTKIAVRYEENEPPLKKQKVSK